MTAWTLTETGAPINPCHPTITGIRTCQRLRAIKKIGLKPDVDDFSAPKTCGEFREAGIVPCAAWGGRRSKRRRRVGQSRASTDALPWLEPCSKLWRRLDDDVVACLKLAA